MSANVNWTLYGRQKPRQYAEIRNETGTLATTEVGAYSIVGIGTQYQLVQFTFADRASFTCQSSIVLTVYFGITDSGLPVSLLSDLSIQVALVRQLRTSLSTGISREVLGYASSGNNILQWQNGGKAVVEGLEGNLLIPVLRDVLSWRTNATWMLKSESKETGSPGRGQGYPADSSCLQRSCLDNRCRGWRANSLYWIDRGLAL